MRFAWLIIAHEDALQLRALVTRLCPPQSDDIVVVHIDRKSALWQATRGLFLTDLPQVRVISNPVAVRWGHSSQLAATRLLLAEALKQDFDVAHLVSGADWPIVSRQTIAAQAGDRCWIESFPYLQTERMARFRLDAAMLQPNPAKPLAWYLARGLRALSKAMLLQRSQPWGPWRKGSQWWSLPRDVCARVLAELDKGFASRRFAGTVCCDEHVIQTIVHHFFPDRIASNRRFIRWREGISSPVVLSGADWPQAQASGAWMARKLIRHIDPFFLALDGHEQSEQVLEGIPATPAWLVSSAPARSLGDVAHRWRAARRAAQQNARAA